MHLKSGKLSGAHKGNFAQLHVGFASIASMSTLTIRQLPESTKQRLRLRAAANGKSMEAEARAILSAVLDGGTEFDNSWIGQLYRDSVAAGGVDLQVPPDSPATVAEF